MARAATGVTPGAAIVAIAQFVTAAMVGASIVLALLITDQAHGASIPPFECRSLCFNPGAELDTTMVADLRQQPQTLRYSTRGMS